MHYFSVSILRNFVVQEKRASAGQLVRRALTAAGADTPALRRFFRTYKGPLSDFRLNVAGARGIGGLPKIPSALDIALGRIEPKPLQLLTDTVRRTRSTPFTGARAFGHAADAAMDAGSFKSLGRALGAADVERVALKPLRSRTGPAGSGMGVRRSPAWAQPPLAI